jgi:hypothetical protein
MILDVDTSLRIDTDDLTKQRDLIGTLVGNLEAGRTGIAIIRDTETLIGIQQILDTIAKGAGSDEFADDCEGPDCPGCGNPGKCDDCEYERDLDVDPVCRI